MIDLPMEKWIRQPKLHECCPKGDTRRWLLVAEPEWGKIYGVGYEISRSALIGFEDIEKRIHAAAAVELHRRIGDEKYVRGEGCELEAFEWHPLIRRVTGGYEIIGR